MKPGYRHCDCCANCEHHYIETTDTLQELKCDGEVRSEYAVCNEYIRGSVQN